MNNPGYTQLFIIVQFEQYTCYNVREEVAPGGEHVGEYGHGACFGLADYGDRSGMVNAIRYCFRGAVGSAHRAPRQMAAFSRTTAERGGR